MCINNEFLYIHHELNSQENIIFFNLNHTFFFVHRQDNII